MKGDSKGRRGETDRVIQMTEGNPLRVGSSRITDIPEILTIREAAELLKCSKAHLLNVIRGRVKNVPRLPYVRIGRKILIRRAALMEWFQLIEEGRGL